MTNRPKETDPTIRDIIKSMNNVLINGAKERARRFETNPTLVLSRPISVSNFVNRLTEVKHVSKNTVDYLLFKTLNLRTVQIQIIKSVS